MGGPKNPPNTLMTNGMTNKNNERSRQLLKRMVQHKPNDIRNSAKDKADVNKAVKMIILVGCLNYAMVDLEYELTEAGLFKQDKKKNFNLANKLVITCYNSFYNMLSNDKFDQAQKQFLQHTDDTWNAISENVLLPSLEGAYNKVMSLCRLTLKYNESIRGRYDCVVVDNLLAVSKFLDCLNVKDYNMDFLIEQQLTYK